MLALLVSPFFLCFHLLTYFVQSESGGTILAAVTRVSGTLSGTFYLGMLSIFVYGVVAYAVFKNPDIEHMPQCTTLFQCIMAFMLAGISQVN